ncbi:MAG: L,D-transpeptidase [Bacillus sp. (in: firmicutes)]
MKVLLTLLLTFAFPHPFVDLEAERTDSYLIVNKANNKLALIQDNKVVKILPVATGRSNELTPEGVFTIIVKAKNPYYRKLNIPGGDPRNPLGSRWIGFDAEGTDGRTYGVHGTNAPWSIGQYISNGCIRMHNKDVEWLYEQVPLKSTIAITLSDKSFVALAKKYGFIQ